MHVNHYVDVGMQAPHARGRGDLPEVLAGGYQLRPVMFKEFFPDHPSLSAMMPKVSGQAEVWRRRDSEDHIEKWLKVGATLWTMPGQESLKRSSIRIWS